MKRDGVMDRLSEEVNEMVRGVSTASPPEIKPKKKKKKKKGGRNSHYSPRGSKGYSGTKTEYNDGVDMLEN